MCFESLVTLMIEKLDKLDEKVRMLDLLWEMRFRVESIDRRLGDLESKLDRRLGEIDSTLGRRFDKVSEVKPSIYSIT